MIALDTSALVAILLNEPDGPIFADAMDRSTELLVGHPTVLELRMVLSGRIGMIRADAAIDAILASNIQQIAFDEQHLDEAAAAFRRYGKGRGHPASLNFGDCMAYSVARVAGCPLLYKGEDFAATDIRSALA